MGDPRAVRCQVTITVPKDGGGESQKLIDVSLADLGLRPLDILALAQDAQLKPQDSDLDRMIAYVAAEQAPANALLTINYTPHERWDRARLRTFPEMLELARAIRALIGAARALCPEDLMTPQMVEQLAGKIEDHPDTVARVKSARAALMRARNTLNTAMKSVRTGHRQIEKKLDALREALHHAALFGIPAAVPTPLKGTGEAIQAGLLSQAESVHAELERRYKAAEQANIDPAEGMRKVFGDDFVFLPSFYPVESEQLQLAMDDNPGLAGADQQAVMKWLQQAGRVQKAIQRWRKLSLYVHALGTTVFQYKVLQLPFKKNATWTALPFPPNSPPEPGTLSLVLHRPAKPTAKESWAGLLIDEWVEMIPNRSEITGLTFQHDSPSTEAPQTVLIAVPPDAAQNWDHDSLVDIIQETLDLAKLRLVDGDFLGDLGQLLPGIFVATNTHNDTVSTDFHAYLVEDPVVKK